MLTHLGRRIGRTQQELQQRENIRKNQTAVITVLKNTLEEHSSRRDETEAWTNMLEGRAKENIETEQQSEKKN